MDGFCSSEKTRPIPSAAMYAGSVRVLGEGRHLPAADCSASITCEASAGADMAAGEQASEPASEAPRLD